MSCNCFGQTEVTIKNSAASCFVCRGELSGIPKLLKKGYLYKPCSPLVQPEDKHDPMEPMTDPGQCIVAFVGNCEIDATGWDDDCKVPVYDDVDVLVQCVNWPEDDQGNSLFTLDDIELIMQGHTCCIRFHKLTECAKAPDWLVAQNS